MNTKEFTNTKSWRSMGLLTLAMMLVLIVLNSVLFDIAIFLIKGSLAIAIIFGLCYTAFLAYPDLKKKIEEVK